MLRLATINRVELALVLHHYGLTLTLIAPHEDIPGSFWGDSEAGLKGDTLYARLDTPVHSVLHEASHYVCMTPERRAGLERDAGGDDAEESAVCYLQILLADALPEAVSPGVHVPHQSLAPHFRQGSTRAWFEADAADARAWLRTRGVIRAD